MAGTMQTTDIIHIGKTPVAVGLSWIPILVPQLQATVKGEVVDLLKQQNLRYAVIYTSEVPKALPVAGLVGRDPPKKITSAIPAALWLAETIERPTVYVEGIKNKTGSYWFLAARPGKIHENTDEVQGESNALRLLEKMLSDMEDSPNGVDLLIGGDGSYPGSNLVERFKPKTFQLSEILKSPPPSTLPRIKQLTGITPGVILAISAFLILIVFSVVGYFGYQQYKQKKIAEQMLAEQMMSAGAGADLQGLSDKRVREAVNVALKEDTATFAPDDVVRSCVAATSQFPRLLGGWKLAKIACSAQRADATYNLSGNRPNGASAESFVDQAKILGFSPSMGFGVESAVLTLNIGGVQLRESMTLETLPRMSEAAINLPSRFQTMRGVVRSAAGRFDPPATREVQYEDPIATAQQQGAPVMAAVPEASSYKKGTFTMTGSNLAGLYRMVWKDAFITINSIELNVPETGGMTYTMSGHYVVANGG